MNQITILFVDKHPLVRKAWDFLMAQNNRFKMLATCESGEIAVELAKELNPDIIIMDTNLRGMDWLETTRWITRNLPAVKVIGLSYNTQEETAYKIIMSGAMGCLSKMSSPGEIFKAINEVQNGRTYICREMRAIHPKDTIVERISPASFRGKQIITMNKSRLQAYAL